MDARLRAKTVENARIGTRQVWFDGEWLETAIYARDKLPTGGQFVGPAIVEQMDTTIVVEPGNTVLVDEDGNLSIEIGDHS